MRTFLSLLLFFSTTGLAAEQRLQGVVDLRVSHVDGIDSYLGGNYGKFRYNDGTGASLGQLGLNYSVNLTETLSLHGIGNAYWGERYSNGGFTEAFIKFKDLPSERGFRWEGRMGLFYPKISMVNHATAWSSPYTLDYSTLNSWIGEEVRHWGISATLARLGNFRGSEHDFQVSATLFQGNDPAGAMLAWHGWVSTSRQSLQQESLPLPNDFIGFVPSASDPFVELDDRLGAHLTGEWTWRGKGTVLAGYYDNNADPRVRENLQWAWRTRFCHAGIRWRLPGGTDFVVQYLEGNTLMEASDGSGFDLVNNDFRSAFIMASKDFNDHRLTFRLEEFSVMDRDTVAVDNNEEYGKGATVSYRYQLANPLFIHMEYSWLQSNRSSRILLEQPEKLVERQVQLGVRYFFRLSP